MKYVISMSGLAKGRKNSRKIKFQKSGGKITFCSAPKISLEKEENGKIVAPPLRQPC